MYTLSQSLLTIPGIGEKTFAALEQKGITTVKDLLLFVPLRYEDRSQTVTVSDLWLLAPAQPKTLFTLNVTVMSASSNFFRGRSMQKAIFVDANGDKLYANWFNNPFIAKRLIKGKNFRVSGAVKTMGKKMYITQPLIEEEEKESINTNRLVPMYSNLRVIKPTSIRKVLKEVVDNLAPIKDELISISSKATQKLLPIEKALQQLHFPENEESVILARERLAIEELLSLIQRSQHIKQQWKNDNQSFPFTPKADPQHILPSNLPFELTDAQHRCINEILSDCQQTHPMNRLLLGDVGSGKTIVAGSAMNACIQSGGHACLIAPTQVLAEQHAATLAKFFPNFHIQLITGQTKKKLRVDSKQPQVFVGTHAVLNYINSANLDLPVGLVVFDEQHRFGVQQRSSLHNLAVHPHILTMTATPIPRSLMLTIFSHLSLSIIDELPKNRIPTKTWVIPEIKRSGMTEWLTTQILTSKQNKTLFQVLYICPFIDPSNNEAFENVAAVKDTFERLKNAFASSRLKLEVLHGRQKKNEQNTVVQQLFQGEIDILVTTPIVEVGVDLPQASAVIIESAERFGLASLHQLRGRVGRAGQQGYCILFSNSNKESTKKRLQYFAETLHGQELAEFDLQRRGAGDIFGTQQHGFDELQFANWSDAQLIARAKSYNDQLRNTGQEYHSPLFATSSDIADTPVAN